MRGVLQECSQPWICCDRTTVRFQTINLFQRICRKSQSKAGGREKPARARYPEKSLPPNNMDSILSHFERSHDFDQAHYLLSTSSHAKSRSVKSAGSATQPVFLKNFLKLFA